MMKITIFYDLSDAALWKQSDSLVDTLKTR